MASLIPACCCDSTSYPIRLCDDDSDTGYRFQLTAAALASYTGKTIRLGIEDDYRCAYVDPTPDVAGDPPPSYTVFDGDCEGCCGCDEETGAVLPSSVVVTASWVNPDASTGAGTIVLNLDTPFCTYGFNEGGPKCNANLCADLNGLDFNDGRCGYVLNIAGNTGLHDECSFSIFKTGRTPLGTYAGTNDISPDLLSGCHTPGASTMTAVVS